MHGFVSFSNEYPIINSDIINGYKDQNIIQWAYIPLCFLSSLSGIRQIVLNEIGSAPWSISPTFASIFTSIIAFKNVSQSWVQLIVPQIPGGKTSTSFKHDTLETREHLIKREKQRMIFLQVFFLKKTTVYFVRIVFKFFEKRTIFYLEDYHFNNFRYWSRLFVQQT